MTEEEYQRLVEENHNLIYAFMQKHNLPEDWYGDCAIGLCKAAKTFDKSRGYKFSTVAYKCMYSEMAIRYRDYENKRVPAVSLNAIISDDTDSEYNSFVPDPDDLHALIDDINVIAWVLEPASLRDLKIVWHRLNDMSCDEIGKMLGICRYQVTKRLNRFKMCFYEGKQFTLRKRYSGNQTERDQYRRMIIERLEQIGGGVE